jgi:hypothetical protein
VAAPHSALRRLPWSALAAATILGLLTLALFARGVRLCGAFVYMIDDPYIHMSIARNLVLHGTWGVNPGRFEPASSSPLWVLLLAAIDRVAGVSDRTPLVLNLISLVLVVLLLDRMLRDFIARPLARGLVVLAIGLAIPLPTMVAIGMETTLHIALILWLVLAVTRHWTAGAGSRSGRLAAIGGLALLCELTRFESIFLAGALAVIALRRRQPALAFALLAGTALAIAGYAAFSLPRGGMWLPNPVLLKTEWRLLSGSAWLGFLLRIPDQLLVHRFSHMTGLLVAAGWLWLPRPGRTAAQEVPHLWLGAFLPAALAHIQFAALGWSFRYESYLVAFGLTAIAAGISRRLHVLPGSLGARPLAPAARALAALLVLLVAWPVMSRAVRATRYIPAAMRNMYEEDHLMTRFVRDHFAGHAVAINDVGAVGYYAGARIEDLLGLASLPVGRARAEGRCDTDYLERFCAERRVEVAVLNTAFFTGRRRLPASWRPIMQWKLPEEISVGDTVVTILAVLPDSIARVRAAARAFAPTLPARVRVEWLE